MPPRLRVVESSVRWSITGAIKTTTITNTMTEEAQRIAIAEACGWIREYSDIPTWDTSLKSYKPVRTMLFMRKEKGFRAENLPDYLNDLNAMHEAEKILSDNNQMKFRGELVDMMRPKYGFESACLLAIHATAAQRAEAFLRTLNLWKEKQ